MAPAIRRCSAPEPEGGAIEDQGLGWKSKHGTGFGADAITGGPEVTWSQTPTKWSNHFFDNLFNNEWELTKSPAGAKQWKAKGAAATIPDAFDKSKKHVPTMLTTDLSLRFDPAYEKISRRFFEHPEQFADAFARAWFKLTHRDMGPIARYLGPLVPKETLIWQDPIPAVDHPLIDEKDIAALKAKILASGLSVSQLVSTAWASASTFRGSDKRGGANGARIRLAPQKDWEVNQPAAARDGAAKARSDPEGVQRFGYRRQEGLARRPDRSRRQRRGREGRKGRRHRREGAVHAGAHGRVAGADRRRVVRSARTARRRLPQLHRQEAAVHGAGRGDGGPRAIADADRAGDDGAGRRPARARRQCRRSKHGVFTKKPGTLTNDFFVNLLDMRTQWQPAGSDGVYEGRDRKTNEVKWTGTRVDLIFGSHSQLRAFAEVYACADAKEKFVKDFVAAWTKVMNADRFDLA